MRIPRYLSPSSLSLWESNREEFYLAHLAETRSPKMPQRDYMAVGSAFDAFVKSALHSAIFGEGNDPQFQFDAIFVDQVEEHNRDFCRKAGLYVFECYKLSGAYQDLLIELEKSEFAPQFEFRLDKTIDGVPLMGKPDCRYIHESGAHIILDWKVNGFCSKYGSTPYKYYSMIRDGWDRAVAKPSRGCNRPHKGYKSLGTHHGIEIGSHYLEDTCKDWADQLSIYAWMLNEKVGDENVIVCIDQIASKRREGKFPLLRIANHRCRISTGWQNQLMQRLTSCWKTIQSGYIFTDEMSEEDSKSRQEVLEMSAKALKAGGENSVESWVDEISREGQMFRAR
jgi:hypothetical protein